MSDQLKLCYLATPYSRYERGLEAAFIEASRLAAKLIRATTQINFIYSPICHSHGIAIHGRLDPLDYKLWLPFNEKMLELSDVLLVAHMTGWESSVGIAEEVKFFERANKPIYDLYPETMLMARRREHDSSVTDDRIDEHESLLNQTNLAHNKTASEQGGASA